MKSQCTDWQVSATLRCVQETARGISTPPEGCVDGLLDENSIDRRLFCFWRSMVRGSAHIERAVDVAVDGVVHRGDFRSNHSVGFASVPVVLGLHSEVILRQLEEGKDSGQGEEGEGQAAEPESLKGSYQWRTEWTKTGATHLNGPEVALTLPRGPHRGTFKERDVIHRKRSVLLLRTRIVVNYTQIFARRCRRTSTSSAGQTVW